MQWSNEILIFYIFELNKKSHLFGFWTLKYRAATSSFDNKATISCFDCFEIGLKNMYFFSWFESFVSIKIMGSATQELRTDLDYSFFWPLHFLPAPKSLIFSFFKPTKVGGRQGAKGLPILFYQNPCQNSYQNPDQKNLIKIFTDNLLVLRIKI